MAPPKRKTTGGRVTPKKTTTLSTPIVDGHRASSTPKSRDGDHPDISSRYTPPNPKEFYESPRWVQILMLALLIGGVLAIMMRYLVWNDSNLPILVGLVLMLGGLYTATKWH
ncbi:MAG TPA: cell division protein CrgA [Ilumatobacteraceae bacterium]|nr:cell division protein CrgA [Ilumatobacteraceae bacterium]